MNATDIKGAIVFARDCIRGAAVARARGQHRLAALLEEPARRVIAEANAAAQRMTQPSPAAERAQAYARVLLQGLH